MSFILHEYLEGHQIGRQLGIFDSWEDVEEQATEWHEVEEGKESYYLYDYPWGVVAVDDSTGIVWWFGSDCEQMDEWYQDVEKGLVPPNTFCYREKEEREQKALKDAEDQKLNREWVLRRAEWGDWYMIPQDQLADFEQWLDNPDSDDYNHIQGDIKEVDPEALTFCAPKVKNDE